MTTAEPRVLALVLTYDAPAAALRCLDGLARQSVRPSEVLVVDNHGPEPVAPRIYEHEWPMPVATLRLDENRGPAGGHAAGLRAFLEADHDWAWVMDDDVVPEPHALAGLLRAAAGDRRRVALPVARDLHSGAVIRNANGWLGVLVPRAAAEAVGVPDERLFWWTEDTEYLQWRLPRAGFERVETDEVVVGVTRIRDGTAKPAWKYYYEARNQVHHRLWVQRPDSGRPVPRHLTIRVRGYRAVKSSVRLAGRAMARESDGRMRKLAMVGRGVVDGVRGRLGPRVPPEDSHRPRIETAGTDQPTRTRGVPEPS